MIVNNNNNCIVLLIVGDESTMVMGECFIAAVIKWLGSCQSPERLQPYKMQFSIYPIIQINSNVLILSAYESVRVDKFFRSKQSIAQKTFVGMSWQTTYFIELNQRKINSMEDRIYY